jgi:hypothetical protein
MNENDQWPKSLFVRFVAARVAALAREKNIHREVIRAAQSPPGDRHPSADTTETRCALPGRYREIHRRGTTPPSDAQSRQHRHSQSDSIPFHHH